MTRVVRLRGLGALALAVVFIYMILASQFRASCSRWR